MLLRGEEGSDEIGRENKRETSSYKMGSMTMKYASFLFICLSSLCLVGCSSSPLPPALSPQALDHISKKTPIAATVSVRKYEYPAYSDSLYDTLKGANIFSEVKYIMDPPGYKTDYNAMVNRRIYGTASLSPLLTVITLGIVPTFVEENYGISFKLISEDNPDAVYPVTVIWRGESIIGWIAIFANLSPDRSPFPEKSERYYNVLRFAVLKALEKSNSHSGQN